MHAHPSHFNSTLFSSLNDYTNFLKLENSLLLANDRIKSLESLLASKDFIIYHMSMCNVLMAQSPKISTWKPPLPKYPPPFQKEDADATIDFSQSSAHSASSKAASVESQMREGGGGGLDSQSTPETFFYLDLVCEGPSHFCSICT